MMPISTVLDSPSSFSVDDLFDQEEDESFKRDSKFIKYLMDSKHIALALSRKRKAIMGGNSDDESEAEIDKKLKISNLQSAMMDSFDLEEESYSSGKVTVLDQILGDYIGVLWKFHMSHDFLMHDHVCLEKGSQYA
jgi:hypothetical protein